MKIFVETFLIIVLLVSAMPLTYGQQLQQDEATIVQRGQVTDKEREYSKEYKKLYGKLYSTLIEGKIGEIIKKVERFGRPDEEIGFGLGEPEFPDDPDAPVVTPLQFLTKVSCRADAIMAGSVKNKAAHMTDDETLVYTEYEFSIQEVLKNNSASPISVNNIIEITRPGGVIKLDNRRFRFDDGSYEELQKNKEYLLFLRFIPSVKGFIVAGPEGDFALENKSFRPLTKWPLPQELRNGNSAQTLLVDVRKAVSIGCNQNSITGKRYVNRSQKLPFME